MVPVAVIPAAGFGTRVLPASKVVSKELFPLYNKPAIHYVVLECVRAGIKEVILVLSRRKMDILRYFEPDQELQNFLKSKNKLHLLDELSVFKGLKTDYVIQEEQLGLGHAILCAKKKVGERNFAVLLPDDIYIVGEKIGVIDKLMDVFDSEKLFGGVVLVKRVSKHKLSRYGVIKPAGRKGKNLIYFSGIVEKPKVQEAPSQYAVVGRYVFTPKIFDWIESEGFDENGEIQLANAFGRFSAEKKDAFLACLISGKWLDIGSPDGYIAAFREIARIEKSIRGS